ncbi:MAG: ankyrin repeat domain-containing protein [Candidatus Omnitrophica bacterium]|nr:ankyrin repeat domain-containing protein [Candidatus Omnitrophota bacterium]
MGKFKLTPLIAAVRDVKKDEVERLLAEGGNINERLPGAGNAFNVAIMRGAVEIAGLLMDKGSEIDIPWPCGTTPLMFAAENGLHELVQRMISSGADVNARNNDGWTALMLATDKVMVELLISAGAVFKSGRTWHKFLRTILLRPRPWPKTVKDAASRVIRKLDASSVKALKTCEKGELARYHLSWGMGIRNAYGLRAGNRRLLVDCGTRDPDSASGIIMEAVWDRIHDGYRK